jgi:PTH1 family peptidyl-tRNA hydrolase
VKHLIVGLGNIGAEYAETRHNIGFKIADQLADTQGVQFKLERLAFFAEYRLKNKMLYIIKPTTYMNLSGKAVHYWLTELKIPKENMLVLVDELAIDFGKIRMKSTGSDGGHNGLKSIQLLLNSVHYPRLRFGIGNQFEKGRQVDYVLGQWTETEKKELPALIDKSCKAVESFCLEGVERAMNKFN